jgi:hypothetical protein
MPTKKRQIKPPAWTARDVELDHIVNNPAPVRAVDPVAVASLKESFELVGQQVPIVLTADNVLVSGRHRVAAQRARGESTIRAVFIDLPEVLTRVATLDENLCRLELTPFQRGELLAERKDLHEQLHPGSQHGAALKGKVTAPGFTRAMSELTGRGRSTIAEDVKIGQMPESVRGLVRGTPLERRKTGLLELAQLPSEEEQLRACQGLLSGSESEGSSASGASGLDSIEQPDGDPDDIDHEDDENFLECVDTASAATVVESALEPLETWLGDVADSPQAENRYVAAAVGLVDYARTLLEQAASGVEATHPRSAYATRARRAARALVKRAQVMSDELLLIAECDCEEGCSACSFARGFAAVDLQNEHTEDTVS